VKDAAAEDADAAGGRRAAAAAVASATADDCMRAMWSADQLHNPRRSSAGSAQSAQRSPIIRREFPTERREDWPALPSVSGLAGCMWIKR